MNKLEILKCLDEIENYISVYSYLCQTMFVSKEFCTNRMKNSFENQEEIFQIFYNESFESFKSSFSTIKETSAQNLVIYANELEKYWRTFVADLKNFYRNECFLCKNRTMEKVIQESIDDLNCDISVKEMRKKNLTKYESIDSKYKFQNLHNVFSTNFSRFLMFGEPTEAENFLCNYFLHQWNLNKWEIDSNFIVLRLRVKDCKPDKDILDILYEEIFIGLDYMTKDLVISLIKDQGRNIICFLDCSEEVSTELCSIIPYVNKRLSKIKVIFWCKNFQLKNTPNIFNKIFQFQRVNEFLSKVIEKSKEIEESEKNMKLTKSDYYIEELLRFCIFLLIGVLVLVWIY